MACKLPQWKDSNYSILANQRNSDSGLAFAFGNTNFGLRCLMSGPKAARIPAFLQDVLRQINQRPLDLYSLDT